MKLKIWYASMIAMFLLSSVAFGAIHSTGTGSSSKSEATASGSTTYDPQQDYKWIYKYTDESGTFSWDFSDRADARTTALLFEGEYASATAAAEAIISVATTDDQFVSASVSGTGEYDGEFLNDDPDEQTNADDGYAYLEPYEGIGGESHTLAVASIEEGSDCLAFAEASAYTYVNLYE